MDIRELAAHLNISIGTVSRALNGRKDVSPHTRERVIAAADALGYTPNQSGRTLRIGRTGTIGFMLTLEHDSAVNGDPFFMALLEGVQRGLGSHNLDLVILLAHRGEDGLTFLRRHVARGTVDGWLLSATRYDDQRISFLRDRGIPFVALGRTSTVSDYPWIDLDFEGVVSAAMKLFFKEGHRRIGLVAPHAAINNSHIVVDAYRAALNSETIPVDDSLIHYGDTDENDGKVAARKLMQLPAPPSALLLMGETAPIGAYRELRAMGLEPGTDVAIVGLRDNPACRVLMPQLTCFTIALEDLGQALADALIGRLSWDTNRDFVPTQMLWPMMLKVGSSHQGPGKQ